MEVFIKANGCLIVMLWRDVAFRFGQMAQDMMDFGKMERRTVMEDIFLLNLIWINQFATNFIN